MIRLARDEFPNRCDLNQAHASNVPRTPHDFASYESLTEKLVKKASGKAKSLRGGSSPNELRFDCCINHGQPHDAAGRLRKKNRLGPGRMFWD